MATKVRRKRDHKSRPALQMWIPWMGIIALCWVCVSGVASAQVPRIQGQGAAASAMGNAFAAQADDPSALHYNPDSVYDGGSDFRRVN